MKLDGIITNIGTREEPKEYIIPEFRENVAK